MGVRCHSVELVTITPMRLEDLPAIAEIERRSFTDPWSENAFRQICRESRVFFVCARDARDAEAPVLGYVVAWFVADEGEIANLAVAPEARGTGVGGALLDSALAEGLKRHATAVYLEVRESNIPARRLYASRGFEGVGRRRQYYRRPAEDAVILRKTITGAAGDECSG